MNNSTPQYRAWLNYMKTGGRHFRKGQLKEAIHAFDEAIEQCPDRVEGWINLGSALLEAQQFEGAVRALDKAVSMAPKNMVAHMVLGDTMRMLARRSDALKCYQQAVALHRNPTSLNKLACELRAWNREEEAEELYREALQLDPGFSLAKINRATLAIQRQRYDEAGEQLAQLTDTALTPSLRREAASARSALSEYRRLGDAITAMTDRDDLAGLESLLATTPDNALAVDRKALKSIERYMASIWEIASAAPLPMTDLPAEWPLVEAMHMIPLVHSVSEYRSVRDRLAAGESPEGEVLESLNMRHAIEAARDCCDVMGDPVKAELHLRHWHSLTCRELEGFQPGHLKYTQNWTGRSPTMQRVDPAMASGTLRYVIDQCYSKLSPGVERAAIAFLAISDLHPFADGNGRVALTWLNRELEWAGLMPALFSKELGLKGRLGEAVRAVRNNDGDVTPLIATIAHAQHYALEFCTELASGG